MPRQSKRARNGARSKAEILTSRRRLPILVSGNGHAGRSAAGGNGHGAAGSNGHSAAGSPVACTTCGLCCTYVVLDIDPPTTLDGASTVLWYLYHPGLSVYTADGEWMVQFDSRCKFLQPDNRCGIYETRPSICREFDERECEVNSPDVGLSFYEPQAFLDWLAQHHKRIHTLLGKRYLPAPSKLAAAPANARPLPPFAGRVRALRAQSHPG